MPDRELSATMTRIPLKNSVIGRRNSPFTTFCFMQGEGALGMGDNSTIGLDKAVEYFIFRLLK